MEQPPGFRRRRGNALYAEQARRALGLTSEVHTLADVPLPLVHTALGIAVCAVAVLVRPQAVGTRTAALASLGLAAATVALLQLYDRLVTPPANRPGIESTALPAAAVGAFAAVLSGAPELAPRMLAGLGAALIIGGIPHLGGLRAVGREHPVLRWIRDAAGVLVLLPLLLVTVSGGLAAQWRVPGIAAGVLLVSYDALLSEEMRRRHAAAAACAIAAAVALLSLLVGATSSGQAAGLRAGLLLVLWYGLRGAAAATMGARRLALAAEYAAFVVLALGALGWLSH